MPAKQTPNKPEAETQAKPSEGAPALRVTAKRDGFYRAGRAWSGTTVIPLDELSEVHIAQLRAEPMLVVEDTTT